MRVTIEIPTKIAADLKRVVRRSQLSHRKLSLPEIVATCITFGLFSSKAKRRHSEEYWVNHAWKLIAMQPRSHE